ncbi:MAG: hypothetical protein AMXMBFR37_08430 [Steroidobacteraceae bacterium]|nr:flagellar biosynthesis anti-sigma factor FlgM [Steroidobacteraceae bacterium]
MSTKINGLVSGPAKVGENQPVARSRGADTGGEHGAQAGTGVHITEAARQLAALEQYVKDLPVVDEVRVAALRSAIQLGHYKFDPEATATKLMCLERDLATLGLPRK